MVLSLFYLGLRVLLNHSRPGMGKQFKFKLYFSSYVVAHQKHAIHLLLPHYVSTSQKVLICLQTFQHGDISHTLNLLNIRSLHSDVSGCCVHVCECVCVHVCLLRQSFVFANASRATQLIMIQPYFGQTASSSHAMTNFSSFHSGARVKCAAPTERLPLTTS